MTGPATRLGLLHGDGIGPEIVPATVLVVEAAVAAAGCAPIEWIELPTGWRGLEEADSTLPEHTHRTLAELPGWITGPHDSSAYPQPWRGRLSPHGALRQRFELYANLRPVRVLPGVKPVVEGIDVAFARENTEGFYSDRAVVAGTGEVMPTADVALNIGVFTRRRATQIAHAACRLARQRRGRVTVVHKAHVLALTMGLYLDVAREVAATYPDVVLDEVHVDAATVHLVRDPGRFDVLLTENMHGDILSDLAGELAGALGMSPSLNAGDDKAMAQAAHGSAPDIAGRGVANPIGLMLSAELLLRWLDDNGHGEGLAAAADLLRGGVEERLAAGRGTPDLRGPDTTAGFAEAVAARITSWSDSGAAPGPPTTSPSPAPRAPRG
ncbi:isocitrate/isopropylmalate dehydrogenase family protein [Jiangella asiatica]|uniref:Isocitrate/isopropylmalate dehydrogenase family protein n=1 Tax=Jiangella asiatica TaxID=2530372 RepID=A0A4R5D2D6_9ACTN|nr:isocitrate/isopropylmalate family dehydrogenase [Jiangella asiatica]TDE07439.1 isocitrate/isopropylmalate dehydrogenase family protein [Jiangella asiatica]